MIRQVLDYAEFEFNLDRPREGHTLRSRYQEAALQEPRWAVHLHNPVQLPQHFQYVLEWFFDLSNTGRTWRNGFPSALSSTEIWSWCQLNGIVLEPWELRLLRRLDVSWRTEMTKKGDD